MSDWRIRKDFVINVVKIDGWSEIVGQSIKSAVR